jgi:hypothetical protein
MASQDEVQVNQIYKPGVYKCLGLSQIDLNDGSHGAVLQVNYLHLMRRSLNQSKPHLFGVLFVRYCTANLCDLHS